MMNDDHDDDSHGEEYDIRTFHGDTAGLDDADDAYYDHNDGDDSK